MNKRALLFLMSCLFLLTACGSVFGQPPEAHLVDISAVPQQEEEEAAPQTFVPRPGGTLRLSMRNPHTLNPLLNTDVTVNSILNLMFEPLAILDEQQRPIPNLAESFYFALDGRSAVIRMRPGIFWSDGQPITAHDLAFSLDTIYQAGQQTIYKNVVYNMTSWYVLDDFTVEIHYREPSSSNIYLLCFPLIPRHHHANDTQPLSSGFFRFQHYITMDEMLLTANPRALRGQPYIERVSIIITPDKETDLYAFNQGIIDVAHTEVAVWGRVREQRQVNITDYVSNLYEFIGFNFRNPLLQELQLRQAIAHSINIPEIVESIYLNHATLASSPVNPASWLYETPSANHTFSLETAQALLRSVRARHPEIVLTLLVNEENDERVTIARILQDNLESIGVICQLYVLPFEEYQARIQAGNFDMFIGGFTKSLDQDWRFAFHSNAMASGRNVFRYYSETMDQLLMQTLHANRDETFRLAKGSFQEYFADNIPVISLVYRNRALLTDLRIGGEKRPVLNNIFHNVHEWYIM